MALQTKDPSTAAISSVGTAASGGTTSSTKPVITGTADAGNIVVIYDGIKPLGSVIAGADGKWTFTPTTDLKSGAHSFAAIAHDTANNFGASSAVVNVTITPAAIPQPAAPTMTNDAGLPIVAGGTTNDAHPHINGTGTAGDIIKVLDNGTVIGSTTIGADGKWSFTPTTDLKPGAHDIAVIETNPAGTASSPTSNPTHITIDTSTPATPAVPVLTDDNGAVIPAGSTTNDAHPHISGTGTAGDIITVYDGQIPLGSVKIGTDGKWTFTPTTDLSNATHAITVTDTNPAGTVSPHSGAISFTVDPTLPNTPVINAMNDYRFDTGTFIAAVPSGSTVTSAYVAVGGTATANGVVYVYDGATVIGSVTASSTGAWFYASKTYTNGLHDISATQKSPAGVETAHSNHWTFNVNAVVPATPTAPVITNDAGATIPAGGATNDPHPHINGNGTAGDTITVYDNGTVIGSTTVAGDGTWSFTPSTDLPSGTNAITVIETNNPSGNPSPASPPTNIVIDTSVPAKPSIPVLTDDSGAAIPAGSTTNDGHPHISGTGTAGDIITVYDGTNAIGSVKIGTDGKWTFTPSTDLSTGSHSISVADTNAAGTTGPKSDPIAFTFSVVAGAPEITSVVDAVGTITGPIVNGGVTDDSHPTISGKGVAGYTVYIYQNGAGCGSAVVDATGHWTLRLTGALSDGVHAMTATQFTGSGAQSVVSNTWTITVDTSTPAKPAAPTMTDDSGAAIVPNGTTADAHPHINGTGTAGDIIKVLDNGTVIGSTTIGADGKWSFTPSPDLNSGSHDITVIDTNQAGTSSPASNPTHITIDTSVPAAPAVPVLTDDSGSVIPAGSTTADGHPHISGTGTAGDIITVYDGSNVIGSVKIGTDGKWTFTPTTDLSNAGHSITVTDTNAAGTMGPHSGAIDFTVNTVITPTITITGVYDQNHTLIPDHGSNTGTFTVEGTATGYANGDIVSLAFDQSPALSALTRSQIFNVQIVDGKFSVVLTTVTQGGTTNQGGYIFTGKPGDIVIYALLQNSSQSNKATSNSYTITETSWTFSGVPATPATPVLTDDSGALIPAGSTTTDGHPHVSGTGAPGDIVTVYDKGSVIGSTTVGTDGKWTFTPSSDLAAGAHSITVAESNLTGTSPQSGSIAFTFSAGAVPATPATPVLTDDSGAVIPAGSTTTDGHPHISGTGTAGDIITVYDGQIPIGSVKIGTDGKWTFTPATDLSNASHTITVTDTNSAGTSPHSGAISITVATAAPAAPVITNARDYDAGQIPIGAVPSGSTGVTPSVQLYGTAAANSVVYVYDGATVIGSATAGGDGSWSYVKTNYATGAHDLSTTQKSGGGVESAHSNHWTFTVSASSSVPAIPAVPVLTDDNGAVIPAGSSTADGHPHVSGTGTAGDIVTVYDKGSVIGSTTVGADGKWTFTPSSDLGTGAHSITVAESNSAGLSGQSGAIAFNYSGPVTIPVKPAVPVITDDNGALIPAGSTTADSHPHISGTGTAGDVITVYDWSGPIGSVTVGSDGKWTFLANIAPGAQHNITVTESNSAGMSPQSDVVSFTISAPYVPPAVVPVITQVAYQAISQGLMIPIDSGATIAYRGVRIGGTGAGATDTVNIYDGATLIGTTTADVGLDGQLTGYFTYMNNYFSTGAHDISVTITNAAGVESAHSNHFAFTVNTLLQSAVHNVELVQTDDQAQASSLTDNGTDTTSDSTTATHHTVVGAQDAFHGTAANGNETVDLNVDPTAYFKQATAHIEGSKGGAIDTLHLTGDHQVLDLTSLTGQTAAAKVSGIEVVDLGGQHNTLKLSLVDVLNLGEADLFQQDGKQQMMVKGAEGDVVDLSNSHIAGLAEGEWQAHGTTQVGGVTYNVYEHSGVHAELLVQQGVQIAMH